MVDVAVDAAADLGPVQRIWESIGYDEINWTYTPTGHRLLHTFGGLSSGGFYVRPHNVFCSGSGFGLPHWGSGNVYHETADGEPYYDFTIVDQTYDAIVGAGHHVLVELGFTPRDLVPPGADALTIVDSPSLYSAYEAGRWAYPPKDYAKWAGLVEAHARHCLDRYGEAEVSSWLWELWNEPDIFYWRGTPEQFNQLYSVTASAVRNVLPQAPVGGPAVTSGGADFLRQFLDAVQRGGDPLDFVSHHTKGASFPSREYLPLGAPASESASPSSTKMLHDVRTLNRVIAEFEPFRELPAIVDECDAAVPAHFGRYDSMNYEFQNTAYYPVFQLKLMKKLLDLNTIETVQVAQATSWSFYFEGERYFEGTRAFLTAGGIEKPLLNAYRMLAQMRERRLPATSDAAWDIAELDGDDGSGMREEIDALASRGTDGVVAVVLWRHVDDQYQVDPAATEVRLSVRGLAEGPYELEHHRIDAEHSNSYTAWQAAGSPQDPTPEQLASINARQGLEPMAPASLVQPRAGMIELVITLPLPAASLIILAPQH